MSVIGETIEATVEGICTDGGFTANGPVLCAVGVNPPPLEALAPSPIEAVLTSRPVVLVFLATKLVVLSETLLHQHTESQRYNKSTYVRE